MNWTWLITVASIVGVIANIYKKRWCFYVWAVTNATWAVIDFHAGLYSQSALFAVYFVLAIWGIYQWRIELTQPTRADLTEIDHDFKLGE